MNNPRFIQIDEEGYFLSGGVRVTDDEYGADLLENLKLHGRVYKTLSHDTEVFVEAFDEPYVALGVRRDGKDFVLELPYHFEISFLPESLVSDEWDRFHGRARNGVAFVFSRSAQMQFFDLVEEFDDDSFTVDGERFAVSSLNDREVAAPPTAPVPIQGDVNKGQFWDAIYQTWNTTGDKPGWDLGEVAKPLREVLPQIKIPRQRICVLGAGAAHDAAYFATAGHFVTAVDISATAIEKARALYPESHNLKYIVADAFQFAKQNAGQFDFVFEHTFFCAIDPHRREELVRAWRMLLNDGGHFLGLMFVFDHQGGPPFGATEWELRQRFKKGFQALYWTRWKTSIERRQGFELVVYARKIPV